MLIKLIKILLLFFVPIAGDLFDLSYDKKEERKTDFEIFIYWVELA